MHHAQIGALVAKVELDIALSELATGGSAGPTAADIRASWHALVAHLAIEPPRPTRVCSSCKGTTMRDDRRCVHCWAQSAPPAP